MKSLSFTFCVYIYVSACIGKETRNGSMRKEKDVEEEEKVNRLHMT